MATSKLMMRPVILSRPENSADALTIFCDGGSFTTSSAGGGPASAGGRGRCCGAWGLRGSIAAVPGGGGRGRDCTPPGGGKLLGGYCGCGGGRPPGCGPPCCGPPGTPDGGRGGAPKRSS